MLCAGCSFSMDIDSELLQLFLPSPGIGSGGAGPEFDSTIL